MHPTVPITERDNDIAKTIDGSTPVEMVQLLRICDDQLFSGYQPETFPCMLSPETVDVVARIVTYAAQMFARAENHAVILSGAGTSGRLAFYLSRSLNCVLKEKNLRPCFHYLIAGGDSALFSSRESAEDNPHQGVLDLQKLVEDVGCGESSSARLLYIGITCGLSATYIASQLDYLMYKEQYGTVLLGFNPVEYARRTQVQLWDKTFYDVATKLNALALDPNWSSKRFVLCPVVGPEAITGSTRMKGGSATTVLLATIFITALSSTASATLVPSLLHSFADVMQATYSQSEHIAKLVGMAGKSLRSASGHVYYVGTDSLGIIGFIDASECPPTYGSSLFDVRGFLDEGFEGLGNRQGTLPMDKNSLLPFSLNAFKEDVLPALTSADTVIFLWADWKHMFPSEAGGVEGGQFERIREVLSLVQQTQASVGAVLIENSDRPGYGAAAQVQVAFSQSVAACARIQALTKTMDDIPNVVVRCGLERLLGGFAIKLVLNAITTGAHVLKGKVFQGKMIDVKVSNNKLYHRAIGIVRNFFPALSIGEAENCLLQSIYRDSGVKVERGDGDNMPDGTPSNAATKSIGDQELVHRLRESGDIAGHIQIAVRTPRVVPVALILATSRFTVQEALQALSSEPIVSNIIDRVRS